MIFSAKSSRGVPVEEAAAAEARRAIAFGDDVFGDAHVADRADGVAVLGDAADAAGKCRGGDQSPTARPCDRRCCPTAAARCRTSSAGKRRLAVAGDAGEPGDLAAVQRQRDAVERRPAGAARGRDVVEHQQRRPGDGRRDRRRRHLAADHQRRQFRAASSRRCWRSPASLPARSTSTRSLTAITSCELVRDEDDRQPLPDQQLQRAKQRVGFGRRQHRRRLVEDQDARVAVERLQDLDALALADRQRRDRRAGIDGEAELARRAARIRAARSPRSKSQAPAAAACRARCFPAPSCCRPA